MLTRGFPMAHDILGFDGSVPDMSGKLMKSRSGFLIDKPQSENGVRG